MRKKSLWIVALVVVSLLAIAITSTALAQEENPPTPSAPTSPRTPGMFGGRRGGHGFGFGRGGYGQVELEAAAKTLGMTTDELSNQLWGGRSLADLAEAAGVDLQDIRDAVEAASLAALRDAIQQAVEDGTMSQEQADWLIEGLDKGFWDGHGFGFGGCRGSKGPRGGGAFGGSRSTPTQAAPTSF